MAQQQPITDDEQAIRALAREFWDGQRSKDQVFALRVDKHLAAIPLDIQGMGICPACEGVLCPLCGGCHEPDKVISFVGPRCPVQVEQEDRACTAWVYAYQFLKSARNKLDGRDAFGKKVKSRE